MTKKGQLAVLGATIVLFGVGALSSNRWLSRISTVLAIIGLLIALRNMMRKPQ